MPIPLRRSGSRAPRALSGVSRADLPPPSSPLTGPRVARFRSVPPRDSRFAQAGRSPAGRCYEGQLFFPSTLLVSRKLRRDASVSSFRVSTKTPSLRPFPGRAPEIADRFRERPGLNVNNRHNGLVRGLPTVRARPERVAPDYKRS